ncbi:hypothetical protein G7Y89_g3286 [Cudoniella acicularis]|uniref:NmrA-like domain-containing protein n=1 Tax=Cudoniella acicularis TaxID=354080 RepID=A0A8H4RRP2_9HELO|nr:hypothetical protein G7Y89_g3286 [Cudoniella acicularis]
MPRILTEQLQKMLALTSPTGKLGDAVLNAILSHNLASPNELVLLTSSPTDLPRFEPFKQKGIQVRPFNYDHPTPESFKGCEKLFLISSTHIQRDFNNAPDGQGRDRHHIDAIDAAVKAGVKHIYYTSLAFHSSSKAGVMRAHLRTEKYLQDLEKQGKVAYTIIREGLYNESWGLYLGYYDIKGDAERDEIIVAGDGKVSWTSIPDLGVGNAVILTAPSEDYAGQTLYLSTGKESAKTLKEVAEVVGSARGRKLGVKVVGEREHVEYYVGRGIDRSAVEWWVGTYESLKKGETLIEDGTLERLLESQGVKPKRADETIRAAFNG